MNRYFFDKGGCLLFRKVVGVDPLDDILLTSVTPTPLLDRMEKERFPTSID